ncbi:MAG: hypothetical protein AB1555_01345 [Nitrospirota bacterium]
MPKPDSLEFILQRDIIETMLPCLGNEQWQPLYLSSGNYPHRFTLWSALLGDEEAKRALEHDSWDLLIGDGKPGFTQRWSDGKEMTTYHRFDMGNTLRPIVLYRHFHGAFPQYCEIDEEFRLYHDLAEDKARGLLLDFDSSGREIEVVRLGPREVTARLQYLRQFQAGVQLHLAIFIESVRYSKLPVKDVPGGRHEKTERKDDRRWRRYIGEAQMVEDYESFSLVNCKVVLPPPPLEKAGIWPFKKDDDSRTVSFIIKVDQNGDPVEHTSDPAALSNNFGANPGAPHYLTPVFFRREVLQKYFAEPNRYTVADGQLTCLGLWSCQIDNNLPDRVSVFLGDLGRDLPYEERLHWRQFNVSPEGGISEINFRRSFLAQFTDPQASDLVFRQEYTDFGHDWEKVHGWPLFLPPSAADSHLIDTVRIPTTNSQTEFDEQVLQLAKLLVGFLNEKELAFRAGPLEEGAKGLSKLESYFEATKFADGKTIIQFLRDLQTLRSKGSGHKKGSSYDAIVAKLGINLARKPDGVRKLLEEAIIALRIMRRHYLKGSKSQP